MRASNLLCKRHHAHSCGYCVRPLSRLESRGRSSRGCVSPEPELVAVCAFKETVAGSCSKTESLLALSSVCPDVLPTCCRLRNGFLG